MSEGCPDGSEAERLAEYEQEVHQYGELTKQHKANNEKVRRGPQRRNGLACGRRRSATGRRSCICDEVPCDCQVARQGDDAPILSAPLCNEASTAPVSRLCSNTTPQPQSGADESAAVRHPQARTEVESLGQRVSEAFAAYQRDRDGVLAELAALEAELAAPSADITEPLPPLEPGPEEVSRSLLSETESPRYSRSRTVV